MLTKKIAMMMVGAGTIVFLSGCGVPQEEHDAKLLELKTATEEIKTLSGDLADSNSLYGKEQGKVRSLRIELDDASKRITKLKAAAALSATALAAEKSNTSDLGTQLASAESATGLAQDRTNAMEGEMETLRAECKKVSADFAQYKKNMQSLNSMSAPKPVSAPAPAAAAAAADESALDLLNGMSMQ